MKKMICIATVLFTFCTLCACSKPENRADTSLREGETAISGKVEQVRGNILVISDGKGGRYSFCYSDDIEVVDDGWYVVDLAADSFKGKKVTVICSEEIMETYPAQLKNERMLIME